MISNQLIFLNKVTIILTKNFTSFSYLFIIFYCTFLVSLFTFNDFFIYWTVIEFISIIFIGLAFSVYSRNYSQLISYFLIQALASLVILIRYTYSSLFFTVGLVIKLSIFPFIFWFINLIVRFSNFILWLAISLHKTPAVLIIYSFRTNLDLNLFFLILILSVFFRGILIIRTLNFRYLLILASMGNNSWFILSQYVSIIFFLLFMAFYSLLLFMAFYSLSFHSKEILSFFNVKFLFRFLILRMSGLPPFPLFYFKLYSIFMLFILNFNIVYLFIFMFLSSFMLIGYINYLFKYFSHAYNTLSNLILFKN